MSSGGETTVILKDGRDPPSIGSTTGVERLQNVLKYIFARHDPTDTVPPPPLELIEWAERTLYFASVGGVMQGMMQYMYERRHRGMHDGKGTFTRAQAEYKRDSLGRISQSCLKGVMRFGGISALYFGAELAAGIYRARRDYYNATCGGLAAGASAGASLARGGNLVKMAKGLVLGGALGGAIGFPAGIIQDNLIESLPDEGKRERQYRIDQMMTIAVGQGDTVKAYPTDRPGLGPSRDPVGQAIAHLETTMKINTASLSQNKENEKEDEDEDEDEDAADQRKNGSVLKGWAWWRS